jgi:hypothetical protein
MHHPGSESFEIDLDLQEHRLHTAASGSGRGDADPPLLGSPHLATTRFSGRPAPPHPGGAPNCGPHVTLEAYSHEVSSSGYRPDGADEDLFYSYAYPQPPGFADAAVEPTDATWSDELVALQRRARCPRPRVNADAPPTGPPIAFEESEGASPREAGEAEPQSRGNRSKMATRLICGPHIAYAA